MKCPNCNSEIKDGFLLCSVCGKELSYVPTFDAQIEVEMDKALSNVNLEMQDTVDLSGHPEISLTKDLSKTTDVSTLYEKLGKKERRVFRINKTAVIFIAVVLLMVILISLFVRNQLKSNSYESLMSRAQSYVDQGDYENAIPLYESAVTKSEANENTRYDLANAYFLMGNLEMAETVLENLLNDYPSYRDAYALLITVYESRSEYESVKLLLENCPDSSIYDEFRQYLSPSPGFSADEGDYDNSLTLSLLVDTPGNIYYTLDGSEPDESSNLYSEPIYLEEGKQVVRAVFINEYGIKSESISKIYNITTKLPEAPNVEPDGGDVSVPDYIYANYDEGWSIYYTVDGSIPDSSSTEYIRPVPMKQGNVVYKFIAIDEGGMKSDVASVNINLNIETKFTESEAVNFLINSFTATGKLADVSGVASNLNGMYLYKCNSVISSNNINLYLIEEYYKGLDSDVYSPTDEYYGVDVNEATIYSVKLDENKKFKIE